jgi:hypothetical protein
MQATPIDAPRYRVTGRVLDDLTSLRIPSAAVQLSTACAAAGSNGKRQEDYGQLKVLTDQDGNFTFDSIPATGVLLNASKNDYMEIWSLRKMANDPMGRYVIGPGTGSIVLHLAPAASIFGIVRDASGAPLSKAWVSLQRYHPWAGSRSLQGLNSVQTSADGSYRFSGLMPGRYYVVAQAWLGSRYETPSRDANGSAVGYVPQRYPSNTGADAESVVCY